MIILVIMDPQKRLWEDAILAIWLTNNDSLINVTVIKEWIILILIDLIKIVQEASK